MFPVKTVQSRRSTYAQPFQKFGHKIFFKEIEQRAPSVLGFAFNKLPTAQIFAFGICEMKCTNEGWQCATSFERQLIPEGERCISSFDILASDIGESEHENKTQMNTKYRKSAKLP